MLVVPESQANLVVRVCTTQLAQVESDPLEKINHAANEPAVITRLMAQLEVYTANAYTGGLDKAKADEDTYCKWIAQVGWVQPFE